MTELPVEGASAHVRPVRQRRVVQVGQRMLQHPAHRVAPARTGDRLLDELGLPARAVRRDDERPRDSGCGVGAPLPTLRSDCHA